MYVIDKIVIKKLWGNVDLDFKCDKRYNFLIGENGALLHKDLKCKAPLIEPNLRRNLGKWST